MNVFENLIGELKDENLLEDTVIELKRSDAANSSSNDKADPALSGEFAFSADSNDIDPPVEGFESNDELLDTPEIIKPADEREFFKKRAIDEVSSLQMVEHVLAGVEREHLKMPAAPYDDLEVKKALHKFLQVAGDVSSDEHAEAEYALMQETQGWHTALSTRDKNVSVANIRRFCENSRPVLSSQALMALARFYRNSPFTEDVRGKFDYVATRLFSRDAGFEQRKLLFGRDEMVGHIKTLYDNWSSISYHNEEDHQEEIDLAVQRFNDLIKHFETAESFDELLNADVFNNIRQYKEECGELFFVSSVMAAIDCNVRLGNKYVDLIFKGKEEYGAATVEGKYGYTYDQIVSAAAGKTLLLVELLRERPEDKDFPETEVRQFEQESFDIPRSPVWSKSDVKEEKASGIFGVNKWILAATLIVAFVSGGIYLWADKFAGAESAVAVANELDLEGTGLKTHIRTMRVSNETAYGVTQSSWDAMSEDEQKEFLKKVFAFAESKGLKKVNLLNYKGRTVAFAAQNRLEIYQPS